MELCWKPRSNWLLSVSLPYNVASTKKQNLIQYNTDSELEFLELVPKFRLPTPKVG